MRIESESRNMVSILAIDAGTTESGYAIICEDPFKLIRFGKVPNEELLDIVKTEEYGKLVYEEFQSYGMPIGESTIKSITWNGRYIQSAKDRGKETKPIYRKDEKITLCGSMKAKDANIRQVLIDRYATFDFKNGKGTKANQDTFYGVSKDVWQAIAVGVTFFDKEKETDLGEGEKKG